MLVIAHVIRAHHRNLSRLLRLVCIFAFVLTSVSSAVYTYTRVATPAPAYAATSSTINYQGRLLTAAGSTVPDGNYHIEFKLYTGGTQGGPGGVGEANAGTLQWTETRSTGNLVRLVNGYFSVNLGSVTALPAIDWSQEYWLTMNVGGSGGAASWDGEMLAPSNKRTKLTAVPYAFQAGNSTNLGGISASDYARLSQAQTFTGLNTFTGSGNGTTVAGTLFKNAVDSDTAFQIQRSNSTVLFNLSTTGNNNSVVGINLAGNPQATLDIGGTLRLSGTTQVDFQTPLYVTTGGVSGALVPTKINIPVFDPGNYGQILAFGLPSTALGTSRAISVFDERAGAHRPTISVLSPDESNEFGFSWEGSNTVARLKTQSGDIRIRSGTTDIAAFAANGDAGILGKLYVNDGVNTTTNAGGVQFGTDTYLYRGGANHLQTGGSLGFLRTTSTDAAIATAVTGDAADRYVMDVSGKMTWGSGTGALDTNLYRSAADTLKTDDSLVVAGSGLFQASTNSTTAFQIQKATGSDTIFRGDTSNNRLIVGNATAATGADATLFIVDTTSTANLPTGVNGGIIYDSTTNKFKIFEDGSWKVICNMTDLGCGSGGSLTLQGAYDGSGTPALISTSSATKNIVFKSGTGYDSTGMFQIQNAATGPIFTADTLNANINIGVTGGTIWSDNFDDGNLTGWDTVSNMSASTTRSYSGTYSAKSNSIASDSYASENVTATSTLNLSAYVNIDSVAGDYDFLVIGNGTNSFTVYIKTDGSICLFNGYLTASSCTGAGAFPFDTWKKVEIRAVKGATGPFQLYVDDALVTSWSTDMTTSNFTSVTIGNPVTPRTGVVYIDDVEAHTAAGVSATLNANGNFNAKGTSSFTGPVSVQNNYMNGFEIQDNTGSSNLFVADTVNNKLTLGASLFKNFIDSGSALVVQNAAGQSLLTADTTGTGALTVSGLTTSSYDDEFNSGGPTPDVKWTFTGTGTSTVNANSSAPGKLRINNDTSTTLDCWGGSPNCNRLLQTSAPGDVLVETKIDTTLPEGASESHSAGIFFFKDNSNYLRFELMSDSGRSTTSHEVTAHTRIAGTGTSWRISCTGLTDSAPTYLRVNRAGDVWTLSYSTDGLVYTSCGSFTQAIDLTGPGAKMGLYTQNYTNLSTFPAADFDYFRVTSSTPGVLLHVAGSSLFKNVVDSSTALQVQDAAGGNVFTIDTSNPTSANLILGGANKAASAIYFQQSGVNKYEIGSDSSGLAGSDSFFVYNNTTSDYVFGLTSDGEARFRTGNDTTRAFEVQNAAGAALLTVDSTNYDLRLVTSIVATGSSTGVTATTSGTGTNVTTLTFTGTTSFGNDDVLYIDNAGQDYYTRITAGGNGASVSVSPAVTFENARTVTKYNVQNIGSSLNGPPSSNNEKFFQGYFLGGVNVGAGTTTLSDGSLQASGDLNFTSTGGIVKVNDTLQVTGNQFTNDGSTLYSPQALTNFATGGVIGTAASTVDVDTTFTINQTTASQTISLPAPTNAAAGRMVFVLNVGSTSFTMYGVLIAPSTGQVYIWNGTAWILGSAGGGSTFTLQAAYDVGNTIATSDARDLSFTLSNTSTDGDLKVNVATGSTGKLKVQDNGTDVFAIGSSGQLALSVQGNTGGLLIGGDVNLYRSAADTLRIDDKVQIKAPSNSAGIFQVQNAAGTTILDVNTSVNSLQVNGTLDFEYISPAGAVTTAVNAVAGNLNGTQYYVVTFVTASGETGFNSASSGVTPLNQQVSITNIPVSPSPRVIARKIYRANNGNSLAADYYLVTTINDNTTTSYNDNIADVSLGAQAKVSGTYTRINFGNNNQLLSDITGQQVFLGYNVGQNSIKGYGNTGVGYNAFQNLQNATQSNAFGQGALQALTNGTSNSAFGNSSASSVQTGYYNTALGNNSLGGVVSGYQNTAVGNAALTGSGSSSHDNSAFGHFALSQSTGNFNVGVGSYAGYTSNGSNANTSGTNNTFIGYQSGPGVASALALSYSGTLGAGSVVNSSSTISLGCTNGVNGCTADTKVSIASGGYGINPLTVSSARYTTGTITQSGTAITGSGTTFTAGMTGGTIFYLDGVTATVTYVDATHLTSSISKTIGSAQAYTVVWGGFNVKADGSVSMQNTIDTTTSFQIQNAAGGSLLNVDSLNSNLSVNGYNTGEIQAWTTSGNSLPGNRNFHVTAQANGYVYAIGGDSGVGNATVYYSKLNADGSVGAWTTSGTPLPNNRYNSAGFAANGYVYVIGGSDGSGPQSTVLYAKLNSDGTTGSWQTNTNNIPATKTESTGVAYNGYAYVVGGTGGTGTNTVYVAKLNPDGSTGTWTSSGNTLPAGRTGHSTVVANGYMYVLGGGSNSVYYSKLNADGTNNAFSTETDVLPASRQYASSVVLNGYIYVIGGTGANTVYYSALNGDGSIGAWTTSGIGIPAARRGHTSVAANGYIYMFGGFVGASVTPDVLYTSTARIKIGGSIDLVGYGGENLSEGGSGGQLTAGNTNIIGDLNLQGDATFARNLSVGGTLGVSGAAVFKNLSNSTTAFQIQNSSGVALLTADTTNSKLEVIGDIYSPGLFWTARTSSADNTYTDIAYGNGTFVASSPSGPMTSTDGVNWTSRSNSNGQNWSTITYGDGLFVSTSTTGTGTRVQTSPDGFTWTNRNGVPDLTWNAITYGNGLFVAVSSDGTGNRVMTSPDGVTWTSRTSASDSIWQAITYGNGKFVAVGTNAVMTSPDGITWTSQTAASADSYDGVTYGKGLFVAVSSSGTVMTSPNGTAWTLRTAPNSNPWSSVTYGEGLFVAVANTSQTSSVMTSIDGITWTARVAGVGNQWRGVTYGNGMFVAVAQSGTGNRVMTSGLSVLNEFESNRVLNAGIKVYGTSQFISSTNSTTAFQVQNSSGANLLSIDSTNSNITVLGNNTGEPQTWNSLTASLTSGSIGARDNAVGVVYNGYYYITGGDDGTTTQTTVAYHKIDANGNFTGNWATTGSSVPARGYHASVQANGYLYIIGGSSVQANSDVKSEVYYAKINKDGTVGAFAQTNALPSARKRQSAVVLNGYIYAIGGDSSATSTPTEVDDVYYAKLNADGTTGTWSLVSNATNGLPAARHGTRTVTANGYIYVLGGANGGAGFTAQNNIYYVKPASSGDITGAFTSEATNPLPGIRYNGGAYIANGYVYYAGGNSGGTRQSLVHYAPLNANGSIGTWAQQNTANDLPTAVETFNYASANGYFYAISGWAGSSQTAGYYASIPRLLVGSSLDLVGLSGENLAEGGSGGELTAGNTNIIGNLGVTGTANILQGLSVGDSFNVGGSALFKNGINSTSAFQVQNATSDLILNADTTNNRLIVGNATATTGAETTLFVVDSAAATANLPTGVNGGIVYDAQVGKFKIYEGGAYKTLCNSTDLGCGSVVTSSTKVVGTSATAGPSGAAASLNYNAADYINASNTSAQTTINTAITAVSAAGGGIVHLMEGTYVIDGSINMLSNVTLEGSGGGTIIKLKASSPDGTTLITNAGTVHRVRIANLRLDGNRASQGASTNENGIYSNSGSTVTPGITVENVNVEGTKGIGIFISGYAATVSNNNVYDTASSNDGINVQADQSTITGNTVRTIGGNGIYTYGDYNVVSGNIVKDVAGSYGIQVLSFATNVTITGNTVTNITAGTGINTSANYTTITGNTIASTFANGLEVVGSSSNSIVSGNILTSVGTNSAHGIYVANGAYNTISNNRIESYGTAGSASYGINLNASTYTTVSGNQITDTGTGAAISTCGVGNTLSGNSFSGTGASTINDSCNQGTIYSSQTNSTGDIALQSSSNGVNINNIGAAATSSLTVRGAYTSTQLATPAQPTVATVGTAGTIDYTYTITATDGVGETLPATVRLIATGNATLTGGNFNRITWTKVAGAFSYKVYRTAVEAGGSPSSTGYIGTVLNTAAAQFDDTGIAATGSLPTINATGGGYFASNIGIGVTPTNTGGLLQLAAGTTAVNGIGFGTDTNLYRSANDVLRTDDSLSVGTNLTVTGTAVLGASSTNGTLTVNGAAGTSLITLTPGTGASTDSAWININSGRGYFGYDGSIDKAVVRGGTSKGLNLVTNDTTVAASFASDGSVTFKNGSNSTAAVLVQTAGGSPDTLFTANTTNNRIKVGNDTASAAADTTLFVVDSAAATANLPTGVNGGIVYDAQVGKFKIYEGGAYKTLCNTTDLACSAGGGGGDVYLANNQTFTGTNMISVNNAAAFKVQTTGGSAILTADTSASQVIFGNASNVAGSLKVYGSNGNAVTLTVGATANYTLTLPTTVGSSGECLKNSGTAGVLTWGACSGAGSGKRITLIPEFPGGTLTADGSSNSGTMTTDTVSGLSSGQGYKHNFYEWSTDQAGAQDYDITMNYQLPSDFSAFTASSFQIWTYADSLTSTDVTVMIKDVDGTSCYASAPSVKPGSAATWDSTTNALANPGNGCTFAANDIITITIKLSAITPQTNKVRVGELRFEY